MEKWDRFLNISFRSTMNKATRCILTFSILSSLVDGTTGATEKIWLPGATGSGPYEVANAWATAFKALYPESDVTLSSVGSGSAQKALWGDIDCQNNPVEAVCAHDVIQETVWGLGDAPINQNVYDDHPFLQVQQFPSCAGAVAIVYSNEVSSNGESNQPLRMTFDILSGIFNTSISYWDDPLIQGENPILHLPHEKVSVVVRSDSSGQTSILTDAIGYKVPSWPEEAVGKKPDWLLGNLSHPSELLQTCSREGESAREGNAVVDVPTSFAAEGKNGVSLGMLRLPYAVGYLEVGTASRLADFLSPVKIGEKGIDASFVPPNPDSLRITMSGLADQLHPDTLELNLAKADTPVGGYPVSGYAYWYIKKNHTTFTDCYQAWLVCKFVEWSYTDPQAAELALINGWIVPPEAVVNMALEKLDDVTCLNTEVNPPTIISALSYVPPPYRETSTIDVVLATSLTCSAFVLFMVILYHFYSVRRNKGDHVWKVHKKELIFNAEPDVIGRGSFGLVILAEYRGTQVAVKRAIPPKVDVPNKGKFATVVNQLFDSDASTSEGDSDTDNNPESSSRLRSVDKGGLSSSIVMSNGGMDSNENLFGKLDLRSSGGASTNKMSRKNFIKEMRILSKLRHPCVVSVMGAVIDATEEPMLVMEYMDHGSLYDILHNDTMVLDDDLLAPMIQDISQGLRFLHAGNPQVIHGDLKAKNVLVDRKFRAKVADFGLSRRSTTRGCGTPYFMAPELILGESANTASTDVYAFGILLYEAYSRKDPYQGEKTSAVLMEVVDSSINKRPPVPLNMPGSTATIMKECLQANPDLRPTAQELDVRLKRIYQKGASPGNKPLKAKNSNVSLFDIFPRHIVEALRDGKNVEPEHKDCVTLFFSDIVGFTEISSNLEPQKVASLLDRLYNIFDDLSTKHDIFKVETVGDAYMCCTNLVKDQSSDHCSRIAKFAIEALDAARQTLIDPENPNLGYVNLRAGFHSGPVVASVVGNRNPRYCLFGDTVNTASRMESTSEKNRIQCSKRSYDLLAKQNPDIPMKCRGSTLIKGKGTMTTYFVHETPSMAEEMILKQECGTKLREAEEGDLEECRSMLDESDRSQFPPEAPDSPVTVMKKWLSKQGRI